MPTSKEAMFSWDYVIAMKSGNLIFLGNFGEEELWENARNHEAECVLFLLS